MIIFLLIISYRTLPPWSCFSSFSEIGFEPSRHMAKIPHPSCSCCLSPDGLHTPVKFADPSSRKPARRAPTLLEVEAAAAAARAECMGLIPPLSKAPCTFGHLSGCVLCRPPLVVVKKRVEGVRSDTILKPKP